MKGTSVSFEATGVQPAERNANGLNAVFDRHLLMIGLWVFAGYYLGCKIGFALTFQPHPVSVLWPPNSVLVAALLLTPPRSWWVVLLAALPAHLAAQLQSHVPPLMIFCWFISNSCEALIGAGLMRYLVGGPIRFTTLRNVGLFCLCVVFIGPFLSSFLDAAFVVWNHWGQGQLLGADPDTTFFKCPRGINNRAVDRNVGDEWNSAPANSPTYRVTWRHARSFSVCCWSVTLSFINSDRERTRLFSFSLCHFLLWAAVRFGTLGASTAISIVGFLAIWSASHGHGPFSGGTA